MRGALGQGRTAGGCGQEACAPVWTGMGGVAALDLLVPELGRWAPLSVGLPGTVRSL